VTGSI